MIYHTVIPWSTSDHTDFSAECNPMVYENLGLELLDCFLNWIFEGCSTILKYLCYFYGGSSTYQKKFKTIILLFCISL